MIAGMLDGISVVVRGTVMQLKTPDHMRGRVSSVGSMFARNRAGGLKRLGRQAGLVALLAPMDKGKTPADPGPAGPLLARANSRLVTQSTLPLCVVNSVRQRRPIGWTLHPPGVGGMQSTEVTALADVARPGN